MKFTLRINRLNQQFKIITFIIFFMLSIFPKEGHMSQTSIISITLNDTVKSSSVILIVRKESKIKEFEFSTYKKNNYRVKAKSYYIEEILWKNEKDPMRGTEYSTQIDKLKSGQSIYIFNRYQLNMASATATYGVGKKSLYHKYYTSDSTEDAYNEATVILFLELYSQFDNTWVLVNDAIESLSARKIIEQSILDVKKQ